METQEDLAMDNWDLLLRDYEQYSSEDHAEKQFKKESAV